LLPSSLAALSISICLDKWFLWRLILNSYVDQLSVKDHMSFQIDGKRGGQVCIWLLVSAVPLPWQSQVLRGDGSMLLWTMNCGVSSCVPFIGRCTVGKHWTILKDLDVSSSSVLKIKTLWRTAVCWHWEAC
jgi:hypothetical protein